MGAIRDAATGCVRALESHYVIGRAPPPQCALTLSAKYVSELHAEVRWTGQSWELKDLGSTNGTYVDGQRLASGRASRVAKSSKLWFGKREHEWEIIDDSCPMPMIVPIDGGEPLALGDRDMLPLPSEEDLQATIYRTADGSWRLERADEMPIRLGDRQSFEAIGRVWRLCCPGIGPGSFTLPVEPIHAPPHICDLNLDFSVSRNEEYVHLRVWRADQDHDMGARQHHFFLLTLARRWLAEASQGEPEESRGWLDQEEVAHDESMARSRLNLSVYRIREQFQKAGVVDFADIIQRRAGQLRIGTGRITMKTV
jgi:hypothetical protein